MKVFVRPTGLHSPAMVRVANALTRYAPERYEFVERDTKADLVVLHVIGANQIVDAERAIARGQQIATIQYCFMTAGRAEIADWLSLWNESTVVWSYYQLPVNGMRYLHAPLGIDPIFEKQPIEAPYRRRLVVTTGHVSAPLAEAIEEVWQAASRAGIEAVHVGPHTVKGMHRPRQWRVFTDITDEELRDLYYQATWVSGLRHNEGFELPALEGLACGARPLLFDQPSQRGWYGDHCEMYLPDEHGQSLVDKLELIFKMEPKPVNREERARILTRFNWRTICEEFWRHVDVAEKARVA